MLFSIKNLKVSYANLIMNDLVAGLPSPLAFMGFADAICRQLDLPPWSAKVLPIFHEVSPISGRTKPVKANGYEPKEIVEDYKGHVTISMLIDLPEEDSNIAVQDAIILRNFAGGLILNLDKVVVEDVTRDRAFDQMKRGWAFVPPSDKDFLYVTDANNVEELIKIAKNLYQWNETSLSEWYVPTAVGYSFLENSKTVAKRKNTRTDSIPHVFAEPLTGIAELVHLRKLQIKRKINLSEEKFFSLFWKWKTSPDSNYILGNSQYIFNPLN